MLRLWRRCWGRCCCCRCCCCLPVTVMCPRGRRRCSRDWRIRYDSNSFGKPTDDYEKAITKNCDWLAGNPLPRDLETDESNYQPTNLPTYQPTNLPTYQPANLPTYQPTLIDDIIVIIPIHGFYDRRQNARKLG